MDIAKLRADVRKALAEGREVELVYTTRADFEAARDALLADRIGMLMENDGENGGRIVVVA